MIHHQHMKRDTQFGRIDVEEITTMLHPAKTG